MLTQYSVSIELEPKEDDRLNLRITFKRYHLPEQQAELILRQLDNLLLDTISSPSAPCSDMSPIGSSLLSVTPAKQSVLPSEVSLLHQFVERAAVSTPDKIALEWTTSFDKDREPPRQWTYADLNGESNRVAHLLQSHGLQPGDLVAVCFEKCAEASFATLGILKAGGAFVALDPDAPIARKSFLVQDSGAKVVLTMEKHAAELSHHSSALVLPLDRVAMMESVQSDSARHCHEIKPDDLCYCLYTSGKVSLL